MRFPFCRRFLLFTLLLCLSGGMAAQSDVDSLTKLLKTAPADTHRVSLLYELAWKIIDSRTDVAEQKLREALTLAQRLHDRAGEAKAWNGLGVVKENQDSSAIAIEFYQKSLALRNDIGDDRGAAKAYSNIGKVYENTGDFDKSLRFQREALQIYEQIKDTAAVARAHYGLGYLLQEMGLYPEAYDQVNLYREYVENQNDTKGKARAYSLLGHIRFELEKLGESRRWYEQALKIRETLADSAYLADALSDLANVLDESDSTHAGIAIPYYMRALTILKALNDQSGLAALYNNLADAYKHLKQFDKGLYYLGESQRIRTELGDQPGLMETYNTYGDLLFGQHKLQESLRYVDEYYKIADHIKDEKYIQKAYKDFAKIYAALGDYKKAYQYRVQYDELRYKRLNETSARDFERKEMLFSDGRRQREIERQQHLIELNKAEIARSRTIGIALIGGAILLILLVGLLFNRNRLRARANRELATKNKTIESERARADNLLKNILPEKTAEELKLHNSVQPVRYDSVTVLFTDFKGFTTIAELVPPEELIAELDECFRLFDAIILKFKLEKIKTIGDSYMCASGLPVVNDTHAVDMVHAAIEMQRGLQAMMLRKRAAGRPEFEMRIGINTGPVVAGVVGSHKFAYDIWGDTVNTAARLEQGSVEHKINISEATYQLVRHQFECTYRGKMAAKNKGEIDMYFVEYEAIDTSA
ncbi:MAG: adenylate/guanylate cyclase domain-containing protein [Bacteroidota bacterium]